MTQIYASARSVLIWLGPSFQGVAEAFVVFPQPARLAIERILVGWPDTGPLANMLEIFIRVRPINGSILRSKEQFIHMIHD